MGDTYRAGVSVVFYGHVDEGDEMYHEVVLYKGEKFDIELTPDDEAVDLDLYITDADGNVIYEDEEAEAGAEAWIKPGDDATYSFYVKAVDGDTDYSLTITEQ